MLRRTVSLCEANADLKRLQEVDKKDEGRKPYFIRHLSFQMLQSPPSSQPYGLPVNSQDLSCTTQPPYELPNEHDVSPMLRSAVGFSMARYLEIVTLPIVFILTFAYLFTFMPALPKPEAYRSLSVIFVLLMGITLQCCFVTAWAARTLGFGDFLLLLRHAISGYL